MPCRQAAPAHRLTERHVAARSALAARSAIAVRPRRRPARGSPPPSRRQRTRSGSRAGRRRAPSRSRSSRSRGRDDHPFDVPLAEHRSSSVGDRFAGDWVAHREARVAVLAVGALSHDRGPSTRAPDGTPRPTCRDAMDRPDAAVLREVGRRRRVPVLGVDDERAGLRARDLAGHRAATIAVAAGHGQAPAGSAKSFWTSTTMSALPGRYRCMPRG